MDAITLASQGRLEPESKVMLARGEGRAAYKQEIGERAVQLLKALPIRAELVLAHATLQGEGKGGQGVKSSGLKQALH